MHQETLRELVEQYGRLRDVQYAAYDRFARANHLTTKELFVLNILWFAEDVCLQSEMCERLSSTKQTISAIIKKFWKLGYLSLTPSDTDRRNRIVRLTDAGRAYAAGIIPPAADAEVEAMAALPTQDAAELLRLTTLFSEQMTKTFRGLWEAHK